jgi:hypothetical protein
MAKSNTQDLASLQKAKVTTRQEQQDAGSCLTELQLVMKLACCVLGLIS